MSDQYSISQLAKEFEVTTRTIRFYEEKGLLHPRRKGTTRIYSPRDRYILQWVLRGKRLGFSLEESHELIAMYNKMYNNEHKNPSQQQTFLRKIAAKREQLQQQQQDLTDMLADLEAIEQQCRQTLDPQSE